MNEKEKKEQLLEWAWAHESTIVEALKLCCERLPSHLVSRFERALDAYSKEKKNG